MSPDVLGQYSYCSAGVTLCCQAVMLPHKPSGNSIKLVVLVFLGCILFVSSDQPVTWDSTRGLWLDAATKQPVQPGGTISSDAQQFLASCGRIPGNKLSQTVTSCAQLQQQVSCEFLEAQGYIPIGGQSVAPAALSGIFTLPGSCGATPLRLSMSSTQLHFDTGKTAVLAVIAKGAASRVFFFGHGTTTGMVSYQERPNAVELCLAAPPEGSLQVNQAAKYSPGLSPGSASWQLRKTVQLPAAFADGPAHLIRGDAVEAAWTLSATKSGVEASYQGTVTGSISLTNTKAVPVMVYGVLSAVKSGPSATVTCGAPLPFKVPACSSVVCNYVAHFPQPPQPGAYQVATTVQHEAERRGHVSVADAAAAFEVGRQVQDGLKTAAGSRIPAGQAIITDTQLPGQQLPMTGTGYHSYVTTIKCPSSGSVVNTATLLAATGQELTASASLLKNCYDLTVRLMDIGDPVIARWQWTVHHTFTPSRIRLQSVSRYFSDYVQRQMDDALLQGHNVTAVKEQLDSAQQENVEALTTTEDVVYTVHFTRSLPKAANGAASQPFSVGGKVVVGNPAPLNAKLAGVTISISDPTGQSMGFTTAASCPILTVAAGQSLVCSWTATPPFNPIGGQVVAVAQYLATVNGAAHSGDVTDFKSAPLMIGSNTMEPEEAGDARVAPTFSQTFSGLSGTQSTFQRTLKQWPSSAGSSSSAAFNPASFLSRVWGHTGANVIVTAAPPPPMVPFAAPVPISSDWAYSTSSEARTLPPPLSSSLSSLSNFISPARNSFGGPVQGVSGVSVVSTPSAAAPPLVDWGPASAAYPILPDSVEGMAHGPPPLAPDSLLSQHSSSSSSFAFTSSTGSSTAGGSNRSTSASAAPPDLPGHASRLRLSAAQAAEMSSSTTTTSSSNSKGASSTPMGLLDDCVDVTNELASDAGLLQGRLVSGRPPSGRICDTAVFVYSVRYGPFNSCSTGSKAVTTARLVTSDTRRLSSSRTEVDVSVTGCRTGVLALITAAKPTADLQQLWSIQMQADQTELQLQAGATANNTYSISYKRLLSGSAARLYALVSLRNLASVPALVGEARYEVNMTCSSSNHTRTGVFICAGNKVPAGGSVNCSLVVPLACASKGLLQVQLELADGQVVKTPVTAFEAPDLVKAAAALPSYASCVQVFHKWNHEEPNLKQGVLISGEAPKGLLCEPKTYRFTAQFGPFHKCAALQAHNTAGLKGRDNFLMSESLRVNLAVDGCGTSTNAQHGPKIVASSRNMRLAAPAKLHSLAAEVTSSEAPRAETSVAGAVGRQHQLQPGSCVHQAWFWKQCMMGRATGDDRACAVITKSLPGGLGPRTPFFPYRRVSRVKRNYRQLMLVAKKTGNGIVDLHFHAAQMFIAAQMNHFWGVQLPPEVRQAYVWLGREYFSVYDDRTAAEELPRNRVLQQQVVAAAQLLTDFNSGRLPGLPTCAMREKQIRQRQRHQTHHIKHGPV